MTSVRINIKVAAIFAAVTMVACEDPNQGTSGSGGNDPDGPTAQELLSLTQNCVQLPGTSKFKTDGDAGSSTIPLCKLNGAIWWRADADIDCDGGTGTECKNDPDYMGETSAKDSQGHFVDASTVPYLVVPLPSNGFNAKDYGIKASWSGYGSAGAIIYNGKLIYAPYADAGPSGVIGELSQAAAIKLGIPSHPNKGGVDSGVTYIVFTGGNVVDPIESPAMAASIGKQLANQLLDNN